MKIPLLPALLKNVLGIFFFKKNCTPCKAEQPLRGMELQEKGAQKG